MFGNRNYQSSTQRGSFSVDLRAAAEIRLPPYVRVQQIRSNELKSKGKRRRNGAAHGAQRRAEAIENAFFSRTDCAVYLELYQALRHRAA